MNQEYLKKQIEQLAAELDTLIRIIEDSDENENSFGGIELVNMGLMEALNINLEEINNIPLEHFIAHITIDNQLNNANLDLLADLLFKTARVFEKQQDKENAKRLFHRTLQIYMYLAKAEVDFPFERHLRIKELREILLQ
ncbi:MAG: hypothetical protein P1P88_20790 [Bacteroidales bacterium]|nr:hypothetical protein [Bacteroidales bacterium]